MNRTLIAAGVAALTLGCASGASAGLYTDDLSRCLVSKTADADRALLIRWIFTAFSLNPSVKDMVNLTDAQREKVLVDGAGLYQRLIFEDCRAQALAAVKNEGAEALGAGFQVLGQVAARSLMSDPAATKYLSGLDERMDSAKVAAFTKEAGLAK
jgi:hypothetical protein